LNFNWLKFSCRVAPWAGSKFCTHAKAKQTIEKQDIRPKLHPRFSAGLKKLNHSLGFLAAKAESTGKPGGGLSF
jgi:hypothetical protein